MSANRLFKCLNDKRSCGRFYRGDEDSFCCPRCWSDLSPVAWVRPAAPKGPDTDDAMGDTKHKRRHVRVATVFGSYPKE